MTNITCPHCNKDIEIAVIDNQKVGHLPQTGGEIKEQTPKTDDKGNVPFVDTSQAKQMRSKINIEGTIKSKEDVRTINTKAGGTLSVCDALLTDDSGEIKITFWGEECNKISDGIKIRITNGYTNSFKGEVALTKGKFGRMEILA
jgi:replication factor A1